MLPTASVLLEVYNRINKVRKNRHSHASSQTREHTDCNEIPTIAHGTIVKLYIRRQSSSQVLAGETLYDLDVDASSGEIVKLKEDRD